MAAIPVRFSARIRSKVCSKRWNRCNASRTTTHTLHRSRPSTAVRDIDPELLSAIRSLHQSMVRELSESLTPLLRTPVEIKAATVRASFFDACRFGTNDLGWFSVLSPEACSGDWHLQITPELCCLMVDRMLGADPEVEETLIRPMTGIERRLMARVVDAVIETLGRGWRQVAEIYWIVRHDEAPTMSGQGDEPIVPWRSFSVRLFGKQGTIRLSIPIDAVESLRAQLCDQPWKTDSVPVAGARSQVAGNVAGAPIDIVANLARSTIRTGDVIDLSVGDVIATEKGVDEPLELTIQNVPKFKIRVGSMKGRKALQIEAPIDPPKTEEVRPESAIVRDSPV